MKKTNITIAFEQEKLKALRFYAAKKNADLQSELDDTLQKLYEKYVPVQTREYIESMTEDEKPTTRQQSSRADQTYGSNSSSPPTINE